MLRAMSTYVGVTERLHPGMLDELVRGGAQTIEIFCARQHFDYTNKSHVREIANWFKSSGVPVNSLHSPMYSDTDWGHDGSHSVNIADSDKRRRIESTDEIKRALEVAEVLPFRFLVQHIGDAGESYDERKFDAAMSTIEHLRAFAKPLGVTMLVENIPNELSTPEKLLEMIRTSHFDDVGVCFDFGHAHIASAVAPDFEIVRDYVRSTHVHDNDRGHDSHLWPGKGTIDWKLAMELLKTAPHIPPLLMEINGNDEKDVAGSMQKAFRNLGQEL
ncbi:MAG: Xylose isomerase-like barrel [Acidobacteriaceae bacterium]|nr:Xylose isomerase-like barrel [Acidobacteriaceae bacterium]